MQRVLTPLVLMLAIGCRGNIQRYSVTKRPDDKDHAYLITGSLYSVVSLDGLKPRRGSYNPKQESALIRLDPGPHELGIRDKSNPGETWSLRFEAAPRSYYQITKRTSRGTVDASTTRKTTDGTTEITSINRVLVGDYYLQVVKVLGSSDKW